MVIYLSISDTKYSTLTGLTLNNVSRKKMTYVTMKDPVQLSSIE